MRCFESLETQSAGTKTPETAPKRRELRSSTERGRGLLAAAFRALDLAAAVATRSFRVTAAFGALLYTTATEDSRTGLRCAGGESAEAEEESEQGGERDCFHERPWVWLAARRASS